MNRLKELWTRWKVQISFVAGALVVSTTMGTCSFEPAVSPAATTETTGTTATGVTTTGETTGTITTGETTTTNNDGQ
tara:strand:- start:456 stop:686 length:231 start_codon:yes stop_codon:yes gene_type:complete